MHSQDEICQISKCADGAATDSRARCCFILMNNASPHRWVSDYSSSAVVAVSVCRSYRVLPVTRLCLHGCHIGRP